MTCQEILLQQFQLDVVHDRQHPVAGMPFQVARCSYGRRGLRYASYFLVLPRVTSCVFTLLHVSQVICVWAQAFAACRDI